MSRYGRRSDPMRCLVCRCSDGSFQYVYLAGDEPEPSTTVARFRRPCEAHDEIRRLRDARRAGEPQSLFLGGLDLGMGEGAE